MHATPLAIPDVILIEPRVFGDSRGFFLETWSDAAFSEAGIDVTFVQDNWSRSTLGVLRGLHFQQRHTQLLRQHTKVLRAQLLRAKHKEQMLLESLDRAQQEIAQSC